METNYFSTNKIMYKSNDKTEIKNTHLDPAGPRTKGITSCVAPDSVPKSVEFTFSRVLRSVKVRSSKIS